jgi:2,5-diamino-6-(ribosylamino)-4(3H)-pyrimidinone 5'-phosphate reductase
LKALRLYPLPARETAAIYEDLELPPTERGYASRPYVIINMVSSVDGKTTIEGKASRIGSEADRRVMRTLRSRADAVMIGAGTLRAERLSLGLDELSCGTQPLAVIVTGTGDVPLETNLVANERQEVLVITAQDAPENNIARLRERAQVLLVPAGPSGGVDLGTTLEALKSGRGVELLLVEGGPRLNHSLVSQELASELFLTLSPTLIGGEQPDALTILAGGNLPQPHIPRLLLVSVHSFNGELYLRYRLARSQRGNSHNTKKELQRRPAGSGSSSRRERRSTGSASIPWIALGQSLCTG